MKKNILGITAALLVSSAAYAGSVTIPNTFSAGKPAVAADVNANFAAIKAAVDDNATFASRYILTDATGVVLKSTNNNDYMSPKGYLAHRYSSSIHTNQWGSGVFGGRHFYDNAACTGVKYTAVSREHNGIVTNFFNKGVVRVELGDVFAGLVQGYATNPFDSVAYLSNTHMVMVDTIP